MSTSSYTSDLLKEIKIETNDPKAELLVITMKAKVYETLKVTPRFVNFRTVNKGESASSEVMVENVSKKPIRIIKIETAPQDVVSISPSEPFMLKPGQTKKLGVKLTPGSSGTYVSGSISLETDIQYLPKKTIHVRAELKDKQGSPK